MRGNPFTIVKRGNLRYTRDGKYRIGANFGLFYAAFKGCRCKSICYCSTVKLPGGIAGTGFRSIKAIQAALKQKYTQRKKEK